MMTESPTMPLDMNSLRNDNSLIGSIPQRINKTETESYKKMKLNQIAKRRAANKVARKARRKNRLHASGKKHCKFNG